MFYIVERISPKGYARLHISIERFICEKKNLHIREVFAYVLKERIHRSVFHKLFPIRALQS